MIYLYVDFEVACIWYAEDWLELRKNHHIVGQLIRIARLPKRNTFIRLPMALLPEETTLLVEKGIATIVKCPPRGKEHAECLKKPNVKRLTKQQVNALKEDLRKQEISKNIQPRKKRKLDDSSELEKTDDISLKETDEISQEEETDETSEEEADETSEEEAEETSEEEAYETSEEEAYETSEEEDENETSEEEIYWTSEEEDAIRVSEEEETDETSEEEGTDEISQKEEETNEISQEEETAETNQEENSLELENRAEVNLKEDSTEYKNIDESGKEEKVSCLEKVYDSRGRKNALGLDKLGEEVDTLRLKSVEEVNTSGLDKISEDVGSSGPENGGEAGTTGLEETGNPHRDKISETEGDVLVVEIDSDATVLLNPESDAGKILKEIVAEKVAKIIPLDTNYIMVQTFTDFPCIKKDEMETVKLPIPKTYMIKHGYQEFQFLEGKGHYITSGVDFDVDFVVYTECPWFKKSEVEPMKWRVPKTYLNKLRYLTFKYFWEQGNYITSGFRCDVDFLVYKGDPKKYSSFLLVKCLGYGTCFSDAQIAHHRRLTQSVGRIFIHTKLDEHGRLRIFGLEQL